MHVHASFAHTYLRATHTSAGNQSPSAEESRIQDLVNRAIDRAVNGSHRVTKDDFDREFQLDFSRHNSDRAWVFPSFTNAKDQSDQERALKVQFNGSTEKKWFNVVNKGCSACSVEMGRVSASHGLGTQLKCFVAENPRAAPLRAHLEKAASTPITARSFMEEYVKCHPDLWTDGEAESRELSGQMKLAYTFRALMAVYSREAARNDAIRDAQTAFIRGPAAGDNGNSGYTHLAGIAHLEILYQENFLKPEFGQGQDDASADINNSTFLSNLPPELMDGNGNLLSKYTFLNHFNDDRIRQHGDVSLFKKKVKEIRGAMKRLFAPPSSGEGNELTDLEARAAKAAEDHRADAVCHKYCKPLYEVILLLQREQENFFAEATGSSVTVDPGSGMEDGDTRPDDATMHERQEHGYYSSDSGVSATSRLSSRSYSSASASRARARRGRRKNARPSTPRQSQDEFRNGVTSVLNDMGQNGNDMVAALTSISEKPNATAAALQGHTKALAEHNAHEQRMHELQERREQARERREEEIHQQKRRKYENDQAKYENDQAKDAVKDTMDALRSLQEQKEFIEGMGMDATEVQAEITAVLDELKCARKLASACRKRNLGTLHQTHMYDGDGERNMEGED